MATKRKPGAKRGGNNKQNLVPFAKNDPTTGYRDPRINRTGIRHRAQLAEAIQNFLSNPTVGRETELIDMLRRMAHGKAPVDHKTLLEYGYGKVPMDITSGGEPIKITTIEVIKHIAAEADD